MLSVVKNTKPTVFIATTAIFVFLFYLTQYLHKVSHSNESELSKLSYSVDLQGINALGFSSKAAKLLQISPQNYSFQIDSLLAKSDLIYFIVEKDSLVYWNNTSVNPNHFSNLKSDGQLHCVKLPTGWYLYTGNIIGNKNCYLFDLIKTDYQVNNPLLIPGFTPRYSESDNIALSLDEENAEYIITGENDAFLLGVNFTNQSNEKNHGNILVFAFFIFALITLFIAIYGWLKGLEYFTHKRDLLLIIFSLAVILIWAILYLTGYPQSLKQTPLFSTGNYDFLAMKSTGDFIINSLFLTIIAIYAYYITGANKADISPVKIIIKYSILWIYLMIAFILIHSSSQQHNLTYISGMFFSDAGVLISSISILLLNIGIYYAFLTYLSSYTEHRVPFFIPIIIVFFGEFAFYLIFEIKLYIFVLTFISIVSIITIKYTLWKRLTDVLIKNLMLLLMLSILSAVLINLSLKEKEDAYQKHVATVLSTTNDPVFETSFSILVNSIQNDRAFSSLVFADTIDNAVNSYLQEKYFTGYFNKFNIQITNCGNDELIEIQPEGGIYDCEEYFNSLIEDFTISSVDSVLFQFNSETEGHYYISRLIFKDPENSERTRFLFIEFISSHVPEGLGYPELLMDKESQTLNLSNFSFARYTNNILTYKFGEFPYNTSFTSSGPVQYNSFFNHKNSRHFITILDDGSFLIVSRGESSLTMKIVIFSTIFILLSLISIVTYFIAFARRAFSLFRLNFKTRLQTFVIGTLTITFILIAVSTLLFIEESTKTEMEKQLTEKTNSVLIELQHKLSTVSDLNNEDSEFLHELLRKFSLVFFSDINLYNKSGELIATSRPEIFDKNLLSAYINPAAYNAIFINNELNYITEEKIGSLRYYSSYVPINLNNYYPIGIVNLPYFARQSEYTKSYYIMLSYLINIYVIIGIIGTLIAVTFSKYLTKPLVLLQDSISNIRIDKQNEKITWSKNDEIGLLIAEYNRMVDKLEQSAGLLAKSERESAWREVAKQIAHEIKNPLTPMKLNVQYLEKAYKNNDPDFSSKIDSISKSLITQIDTLDNVAETFSNFAKNKSTVFENVDLKNVITTAVHLFDKKSNVNISVEYRCDEEKLIILSFEKDTLRVINNIIKNAIQAVENIKPGVIEIIVTDDEKYIEVAISDNGKGIPDNMKSSIFQPYFTTKTSGTGLGLAIVKNIVNESGGEVFFESTVNLGTTFRLRFPKTTNLI